MKALLSLSLLLASASAHAYDSLACGPSLAPLRVDCDGITAARTPWVQSEHAEIWLQARELAGLPASLDEPFEVKTLVGGGSVIDNDGGIFDSFEVVPLGLVLETRVRTLELSVFAQLPDKAYALWDWTSGNESCPPTNSPEDVPECHKFEAHMGWLNSNHFLPQAGRVFGRYHDLALQRAEGCRQMAQTFSVAGRDESELLQACDREAMLLEAIAQHYLQDAWSMGHMWQRWGSPDLADFAGALSVDPSLGDIDAIGDAVGRGSGIIHGAKAITKFADAMCAPDDGVEFMFDSSIHAGAGDLFLQRVESDERLVDQYDFLYACSTTSMREVYLASAQSFGAAEATHAAEVDLADCFEQRATNRSIGLGAAIQIPIVLTNLATTIAPLSALITLKLADVSDKYLRSLGLDSFGRTDFYLPLTSEELTTVDLPGKLIPNSVRTRWHNDMVRIQGVLSVAATEDPRLTDIADGELGPLLGMEPNGFYADKAAQSSYADPPLPWTPTATDVPLPSTVANAANILSRTFVDAHVDDWCGVLHEDGDDEFSLTHLRSICTSLAGQGADAETACDVCASFAEWMVFDPEPDVAANPVLAEQPICTVLAGAPAIEAESAAGDFDRASLARRWCETPAPSETVNSYRFELTVATVYVYDDPAYHEEVTSTLTVTRDDPTGTSPGTSSVGINILYETAFTSGETTTNSSYRSTDDSECADQERGPSGGVTISGALDEAALASGALVLDVAIASDPSDDYCGVDDAVAGESPVHHWNDYCEYIGFGYFFNCGPGSAFDDEGLHFDVWVPGTGSVVAESERVFNYENTETDRVTTFTSTAHARIVLLD